MSTKPYVTHPGVVMEEKAIANLKQKTGRSLEEWVVFMQAEAPTGVKEREAWLKEKQGLTTLYARWLAERASGPAQPYDANGYVEKLFSGQEGGLAAAL